MSDVLPTIENLGLKLISERPYRDRAPNVQIWIQDFELEHPRGVRIDLESDGPRFKATFAHVWAGNADNDGFNRLVLAADLDWREAIVLRTYARWFVQLGLPLSQAYMEQALATNAAAAGHLLQLFVARFDPAILKSAAARAPRPRSAARSSACSRGVTRIDDDRILRAFLARDRRDAAHQLLPDRRRRRAAGRTSRSSSTRANVAEVPLPRPMFEIFVHSPRVEGVHLRMGRVARGGLRWSDRREDFRTEMLGLMKAQNVKNTVIVPVGAKGGFVPRRLPAGPRRGAGRRHGMLPHVHPRAARRHRQHRRRQGRRRRRTSCGTTATTLTSSSPPTRAPRNSRTSRMRSPRNTASGSATRSPPAARRDTTTRRWASPRAAAGSPCGGTSASSASTRSRRTSRSPASATCPATCSATRMLLSPHIRLLAAFDHRHIFLDPSPDAAASFAERKRLFELPRSSWEDYDKRLISKGGGVYSRQSKSIRSVAEARAMLGIDAAVGRAGRGDPGDPVPAGRPALERRHRHLREGRRTRATREIGDRANDAVRVNGAELRCRVVGRRRQPRLLAARAASSTRRAGGRINTDFIDNSAGVNCSDVEVNLKILFNPLMAAGSCTRKARNRLLASMTEEVGRTRAAQQLPAEPRDLGAP